ncbi:MAG: cytochrome c biogenesis protein CcsA [Undibacterium sp.]|nr:cytochrome c biogenesis protein CcsA [Opitutaceae bacterium]
MLAALTDRQWLWLAAEFYLAGFFLGTCSLLRRGGPSGVAVYALIAFGYLLQLVGLTLRGRAVGGCPLGNTFELLQFTAWSAISLYLVVGVTFRSSVLGYFTACLAAVLTLVSLAIPAWDAERHVRIFGQNPWIEMHAALALFSYGVFALLALTSLMLLLRHFSLKSKHLGGLFSFLPSMVDLDHIGLRLLAAGVIILAGSLAVGSVYWLRDPASASYAKLFITIAVWLAYATALFLRLRGQLLAKRFAWTGLVLFGAALLSLWPVDASRSPAVAPAPHSVPRRHP